jgi:hypothetical protein
MTRIPDRPYTTLDRILERTLDFFDEFGGTDLTDPSEELDRRLANLNVLQRRIAAALWLFGDTSRARLLGFPEDLETQQRALVECAGDMPGRFIAVFTIDGETREDERMALCLLQAEVEFRYQLARTFGHRAVLVSVRAGVRMED